MGWRARVCLASLPLSELAFKNPPRRTVRHAPLVCRYRKPMPPRYQGVLDGLAAKQREIEAFHEQHHKSEVSGLSLLQEPSRGSDAVAASTARHSTCRALEHSGSLFACPLPARHSTRCALERGPAPRLSLPSPRCCSCACIVCLPECLPAAGWLGGWLYTCPNQTVQCRPRWRRATRCWRTWCR